MDASARGFHTQLLLIAAQQRPLGTLPDDDAQWRRWLGLPEAALRRFQRRAMDPASVLGAHGAQGEAGADQWLDQLWTTRWRPMLEDAWRVVDAELVTAHPHLKGAEGQRFCAVAMLLGQSTEMPTTVPAASTTVAAPKRAAARKPRKGRTADAWLDQILSLTPNTAPLHDMAHVQQCWKAVPMPEQRQALWDLGLQVLAASPAEHASVRSYLSRLIREFGEQSVAKAVGLLAVKPVPPADPKSYLRGVLRQETHGSPREQQALEARGRVAL